MSDLRRPQRYRAYMLRFWLEHAAHETHHDQWRFSLEDPRNGERLGFASFELLLAFLTQQIQLSLPTSSERGAPRDVTTLQ